MYEEYRGMVESFKTDLTFILGKDEEIQFLDTRLGSGLYEVAEVLKEDMAAGTGLPLNQVYGRAEGGGMDGAGALISKQGELETTSNYQADLADNFWALFNQYWNVEDLFVKFRLDSQKSDRARYEEEALQWDNLLRKAQYEQIQLQNLMSATQFQMQLDNPQMMLPNQAGQPPNQSGGATPASQTGSGGNGGAQKTKEGGASLEKIQKANQDFIQANLHVFNEIKFKPRIVDAEFREAKKPKGRRFK